MPVLDIFSKRQKRRRGEVPDVYVYDQLPGTLRVQVVEIIRDVFGTTVEHGQHSPGFRCYKAIVQILRREYGQFTLVDIRHRDRYEEELFTFFMSVPEVDRAFDVVELAMRVAKSYARDRHIRAEEVESAVEELNSRFKEHGIGYQYEGGELVRVDSGLLHAEAVKPALTLLHAAGYEGPLEEFLSAYDHYRHARHEEALVDALKAFESTMKAICDRKKWGYGKSATASGLVDVCLAKGLIDPFWQNQLGALRATLEGIATARNKLAGHGQGSEPRDVPKELVGYVLHMTASTIVFLIQSAG
jgi:hypothetical protein